MGVGDRRVNGRGGDALLAFEVTVRGLEYLETAFDDETDAGMAKAGSRTRLDNPRRIAVSPDGRPVYVAARTDDAITVFRWDRAGDGEASATTRIRTTTTTFWRRSELELAFTGAVLSWQRWSDDAPGSAEPVTTPSIVTLSASDGRVFLGGAAGAPGLVSPADGAKLAGAEASFEWATGGTPVRGWRLWVGSTPGAFDLHDSRVVGGATLAAQVTGLPTDGRDLYVRLWHQIGRTWQFTERTLEAAGQRPALVTPADGASLAAASATFTWNANGTAADGWALWFGSTPGGRQYGFALTEDGAATSLDFDRLTYDGETVHVTLWWRVGGKWSPVRSRRYTYTAIRASMPVLLGPESASDGDGAITDGEALAGPSATFTWDDGGTPVEDHAVWVGTRPGGLQYGYAWSSEVDPADPASVTELPFDALPYRGETVYITFWWKVRGRWLSRPYVYTAVDAPPAMQPGEGHTLTGGPETFTWDDDGVPTIDHAIWFGATPGGLQYGYSWAREVDPADPASVTSLDIPLARLPTDGSTVHVTFWWREPDGDWQSRPYTMTASGP